MTVRQDILEELNRAGLRMSYVNDDEPEWYELLVYGEPRGNQDLIVVRPPWLDPDPRTSRFIHRIAGPFVEETEGWRQAEQDIFGNQIRLAPITDGDPDAQEAWNAYQENLAGSERTVQELKRDIRDALEEGDI